MSAVLALVVLAPSAFASKEIVNYFGSASGSGSLGGQFNGPRDVAVNTTGNGPANTGDIYVVDEQNHRVGRFDSLGNFISAWGADVVQSGGSGDLGDAVAKHFEVCSVASQCKAGVASGGNGATSGNGALSAPQSIAVDGDTGHVYVSDRGNRRIDEYNGDGTFVRSFGFDVDATEVATGYEICPATNVCKAGVAGAGAGQVGATAVEKTLGIAISPPDGNAAAGTVFLADSQNRRVNTYNLDGTSPGSFGSASDFGATQPRKVTVDSRGIVYASNSNLGAQIERYDSQNANGGGIGFLAPIRAAVNEEQVITYTGMSTTYYTLTCPDGSITAPIFLEGPSSNGRQYPQAALEKACDGKFEIDFKGAEGNKFAVIFEGKYAETDVPQMTCTPLEGGSCSVATAGNGQTGTLPYVGQPSALATATAGLAVDPDSDGGGPDRDALYAMRTSFPFESVRSSVVHQFGPDNEPGLTAAPIDIDDTHGTSSGFQNVNGLGFDAASDRLFVSFNESVGGGLGSGHRVYILADPATVPKPGLAVDPITVKTDTTATFSGKVDPAAYLINCKFQYSADQISWVDVPEPGCASLDPKGGSQTVTENVTGLDPNTQYFFRLAASRPFLPNSTTTSSPRSFETDAKPPVIANVGAITASVPETSARLVASIDPRHSPTGYVFEYGPTPALGSSTLPVDIGGGTKPVVVSRLVGGLTKNTTYYFRVVATNLIGTTTSPGHTFHTRATPPPPLVERAYEQVTPPNKNYGDANTGLGFWKANASINGEGVGFCTTALFGEPPHSQMAGFCAPYVSTRTPTGWEVQPNPDYCNTDIVSGFDDGQQSILPSPDYSRILYVQPEAEDCPLPTLDPTAPLSPDGFAFNLYMRDISAGSPGYLLLNPQVAEGEPQHAQNYVGGSEDFSHVVYSTTANQTPYPGDSPAPGDFRKLYEWQYPGSGGCAEPGGCLRLISRDTNDEPFTTPSEIATMPWRSSDRHVPSAVSREGGRIFFQNPVPSGGTVTHACAIEGCQLYMREGGATTHDVSASECTESCGSPQSAADQLLFATPSGDKAFFASCAKLTDTAELGGCVSPSNSDGGTSGSAQLYRWDLGSPPGHRLLKLDLDQEPVDGGSSLRGFIGASDDGEVAYFVSTGQLVPGKPTAAGQKLYRWTYNGGNPEVEYLAPYEPVFERLGLEINLIGDHRLVTSSGEYLILFTKLAYEPAIDADADVDIYRWSEEEGWQCVSCQSPGSPSAGNVDLSSPRIHNYDIGFNREIGNAEPTNYIGDDGRVFFGTPDALVPEDVNGQVSCPVIDDEWPDNLYYRCEDVYEWNDGTVSLLSSGTSSEPSRLIGSSISGDDVFFYTRDRLVGWDLDNNVDIYNASVGGGFPEPLPSPAGCEGEACHAQGTSAPAPVGAGTPAFEGAGNPSPMRSKPAKRRKRCGQGFVKRGGKCIKSSRKRSKRHGQRRNANHDRRIGR